MNDTYVTIAGNVVDEPRQIVTSNGVHLTNMRLASTSRRFDRAQERWRDGDTLFVGVTCWRSLGDNVAASVARGDPLVVTGRLRMRSYTNRDGEKRTNVEVDASAVGHDLSRGVARFQKTGRRSIPATPPRSAETIDPDPGPHTPEATHRGQHTSADREMTSADSATERAVGAVWNSADPHRTGETAAAPLPP